MEFNLEKSQIYKAVKFQEFLEFGSLKLWRTIFLTIFSISIIIWVIILLISLIINLIQPNITFAVPNPRFFLGLALIFGALGFSILFLEIFFNYYLKYPPIKENEQNLAEFLDFDSAMLIKLASIISLQLKEGAISTNSLLYAISKYPPSQNILIRLGINPFQIQQLLHDVLKISSPIKAPWIYKINPPSEELIKLFSDANNLRFKHSNLYDEPIFEIRNRISLLDIITSLLDHNQIFKQFVINANLDKRDLVALATWYESEYELSRKRKMFWRLENLIRRPPVGVGWTYGYLWYLNHYAVDLIREFREKKLEIKLIGRQKIVEQIEEILERSTHGNVLLVGDPGVGKSTVILGLTQMIYQGKASPTLNYKRVFELNFSFITSSIKDVVQIQNTIISLLNEAVV